MQRVPTIALCAILKDEADNLSRCLAFAKRFDECVVVDTGSTDGTQDLARELGARVVDFPWIDDFAAARNVWREHVKTDWIMWLDGDDEITEQTVHRIYEDATEHMDRAEVLGFLCDYRYPNDYVVEHVRLYRSHIPWKQRIHEYLRLGDYEGGVVRTGWEVYHHGFPTYDQEGLNKRSERNMRLLQAEFAENPSPLVRQYIAMEFQNAGNHEECAKWLEEVVADSLKDEPDLAWLPEIYVHLARTYVKLGRKGRAREVLQAGFDRFGDRTLEIWDRHLAMKGQDGVTALDKARSRARIVQLVS